MPTDCLFREDAYLRDCTANVVGMNERGIVLDRTVFYATSGGQPGDGGVLTTSAGIEIPITTAVYTDPMKTDIAHVPVNGGAALPAVGETVHVSIGWDLRYARMRMHTALHLLSAALPYPVTGGAVGDAEGRLDFDIPEAGLDRQVITEKLAAMIAADAGDHAVDQRC
jgi:misacylated tRNA(Ala) deacylase